MIIYNNKHSGMPVGQLEWECSWYRFQIPTYSNTFFLVTFRSGVVKFTNDDRPWWGFGPLLVPTCPKGSPNVAPETSHGESTLGDLSDLGEFPNSCSLSLSLRLSEIGSEAAPHQPSSAVKLQSFAIFGRILHMQTALDPGKSSTTTIFWVIMIIPKITKHPDKFSCNL